MPISPEFVEILVCPECRSKVTLKPDRSGVKCVSCGRVYPVRDGVAVMLPAEATTEDVESPTND